MSLTPKATGGRGPEYPYIVAYSALIENGFTSSPALGTHAHISLWFKHKLNHSSHHHVDITKAGSVVTVVIDGGVATPYTGVVGANFHELIEGVLTEYAGSHAGYYSDLRAIDGADSTRFWTASAWTPGTIIPRNPSGVAYGTNGAWLDFGDALDLGADVSGNGNDWAVDESAMTVSAFTGGTPTWSASTNGFDGDNLFNSRTDYSSQGSFYTVPDPGWAVYDFGAGNGKVLTNYTLTAADGYHTMAPTAFAMLGSNDGTTWTTLHSTSGQVWAAGTPKTFSFANQTGYRHYKLNMTARNGVAYVLAKWESFLATLQSADTPTNNLT
jgi:hypothetical protein